MKVTQVSYRRVFNLGHYETATVEFVAAVNEGESAEQALDELVKRAREWRKAGAA